MVSSSICGHPNHHSGRIVAAGYRPPVFVAQEHRDIEQHSQFTDFFAL